MSHELSLSRDGGKTWEVIGPVSEIVGLDHDSSDSARPLLSEEEMRAFGEAVLALPDRKQTPVELVVAAACEAGISHIRSAPPLHRPWLRPGKGRGKQL